MPRPRRFRRVWFEPNITYFKPAGIRMVDLDETVLTVDEFESVRLKDFEGLNQEKAAKKMNISQPTFHRLLLQARKKIAEALTNGNAIRIQGGNFKMAQPRGMGMGRGRGMGQGGGIGGGRGMARGRGQGMGYGGPASNCICPKCSYETQKERGVPCTEMKCPECSTMMIRGE